MSSGTDGPHLLDIYEGKKHCLESNKDFTIGRDFDNSLIIADFYISRVHCLFTEHSGIWSVIDTSTNGLYINKEKIPPNQKHVLSNGDNIELRDDVQFKFIEGRSQAVADKEVCNALDRIEAETSDKAINLDKCSSKTKRDLESDLECSICTELFVKAQTLNCSHSFCKKCIEEWKTKRGICPICLTRITHVFPCIALDNLVTTIVESSSNELEENQQQVLKEHKTKEEVAKSNHGRGSGTERNTTNTNNQLNEEFVTVVISSDSEFDDADDSYE